MATDIPTAAAKLRARLAQPDFIMMPACHDALSARLIEEAGYPVGFMSGFTVAAARLALPDTGLASFAEVLDSVRAICTAAPNLLLIADGDTGYGNAINAKRTVREFARAGTAGIMIEDQVSPKRCGHTRGKQVVSQAEARMRIRAAIDARSETDIVIMARTDARAVHGFDDALERCQLFVEEGADIIFLEAPESVDEMRRFCTAIPKPCMANMVEDGATPILPPAELAALGYRIAVYPLVMLSAAITAMRQSLHALKPGSTVAMPDHASFAAIKTLVGFDDYYREEERYRGD